MLLVEDLAKTMVSLAPRYWEWRNIKLTLIVSFE